MTRYEKASLWISLAAVFCSVLAPLIMHRFFNPILENLKYAGKVYVGERFLFDDQGQRYGYKITMENVGRKKIANIEIGFMAMSPQISLPFA